MGSLPTGGHWLRYYGVLYRMEESDRRSLIWDCAWNWLVATEGGSRYTGNGVSLAWKGCVERLPSPYHWIL